MLEKVCLLSLYKSCICQLTVPSSPPQEIRCTAMTSQSLQVSWSPPLESTLNGVLKGYKVTWESIDPIIETSKSETKSTGARTVTLNSLEKHTNYSIQVLASTRAGDGVMSAPLFCMTKEDIPEVPAGIKAVVSSASSIIISWLPPLRANGEIKSYHVYVRLGNGKMKNTKTQAHQTSYQVENLQEGHQYEFEVAAATDVGEGPKSKSVTASPSSDGNFYHQFYIKINISVK